MNNNQMTCDPKRIELFLGQKLSDEEQTAFELHLDDCNDCRRRLEATAAGDDVWSGVRDSLLGQQLAPDCLQSGDPALDSGLDSATGGDASFNHDTVLKLLAPTDDDRMLGRLGTYEVVGVIGSGGMGVVLKAFDAALNRYVAIKVLAPHLGSSGAARKRFSREAQAAAAVVHDNVIEIHGVADADGLPYLVMPYVRGPSLQRRLDDDGPLALAEVLRIAVQAATGLAAAHAQGRVHRDVKPANILLADGVERVKLTDFGLARAADDASLTKTGIIAGTPQYMSPEQARGESIDQRSDLFSLGSVLYAMCTGRVPFRAETSYGVLRRITDEEPRPIREINPDVPQWLCQIIGKLMSKQPDDRFASACEVAELLEECLAHVQQPTAVPLPTSLVTQSSGNRFFSTSRRSLGVIVMMATFGLSLLGMVLSQATAPPDIAGKWAGEEWGAVVLEARQPGRYEGSYTDSDNARSGTVHFKWSRLEGRFNGTWIEGDDRRGKISVRLVDDEIRGAWTTTRKSDAEPGTPKLADLSWVRSTEPRVVGSDSKYPVGPWNARLSSGITVESLGVGPWTDLLKLVDIQRDIVCGQWEQNNGALVVTPTDTDRQHLRLQLPVIVEGGYDLEMEFTRNEGDETVGAVLPVGAGGCVLHLSAFAGRVSGLDRVEGLGIGTPGKSDDSWPGTLINGHRYKLLVRVRLRGEDATVDAILDGKPCIHWTGKQSALHIWSGWALKGYRQLGLMASESTVTFHAARVRPIAGRVIPVMTESRRQESIRLNQWVDLLEPLYLPADAVQGNWVGDDEGLIVSPQNIGLGWQMLMLPTIVEGSYDFEVEFTRVNHDDTVVLGLPAGSRACTFHLSSWNGNVGGLEMIDGMGVGAVGNPAVIRPNPLTNGRRYKVLAKVRTTGDEVSIEVTTDDQPPIKWKGKQSSLGVSGSWNDMNLKRPALGSNGNIVRFHSARLRPISGKATLLRTVDDQQ